MAELFGVPTKALNQAVTRNAERFPEDSMFRFAGREGSAQLVTNCDRRKSTETRSFRYGHLPKKALPWLSGRLRSKRAVEVNISVMRAFVRLREVLATKEELARRVTQHDRQIAILLEHVHKILAPQP